MKIPPFSCRNLFVVWHWLEYHNQAIPIEGDSNTLLHCLSDTLTGAELDSRVSKIALPGTQNILLLHENSANPYFQAQDEVRKQWDDGEKWKAPFLYTGRFSKGEDFIYYRWKEKTGLCMPKGYLTLKSGIYPEIRSVLNPEGTHVLRHYFDPVWDYYAIAAKHHVFDLKENLFIHLAGQEPLQYGCTLPELEGEHFDFLKKRHRAFTNLEREFQKSNLKDVETHYTILKNHLDTTPINTDGYLHTTGKHFRHLLGAMPGNIH